MRISFKDNNQAVINDVKSTVKTDESDCTEVSTEFNQAALKGWYKEICFSDFKIGYGEAEVYTNYTVHIDFVGETIEMTFLLDGQFTVSFSDSDTKFKYQSDEHNVMYCTSSKMNIHLEKGFHKIIRMNLSVDFFNQYIPEKSKFKEFKNRIKTKETGRLQIKNLKITHDILALTEELFDSKKAGLCRKLHLNSRLLELLLLQLNQFMTDKNTNELDEKSLNTVVAVKEYLSKNYTESLSLDLLSKKFGTNEFSLKKNFKALYGDTVFGYIFNLKMNKAKELLTISKLSVNEVSEIIGYKNPQHFSTAFKKKYGVTPSKFR